MLEQKMAMLAERIERFTHRDGPQPTRIGSLYLYRASSPSEPIPHVHEPALCMVARGNKRVMLADQVYHYGPAHFLIVSVDLPVCAQIVQASPEAPFLGLRINLDPCAISELLLDVERPRAPSRTPPRGLAVSPIEAPLLDAVVRLLQLLDTPEDIPILAPLMIREITYRLLTGNQGARLRQIAAEDGHAQSVATAIHWLKRNYSRPCSIETLAREVHMSASALHHQFKAVTALSPLQYQKQLRLQEARRLMLAEALDAATAGYRVGYESASQFNREYRRLFGAPPHSDVASLRGQHAAPLGF
jgi:AraC-like DNA-binding protein